MIENYKFFCENFPGTIVFIKSGNFYRCYDDDSYIIAYLMDYQVKATISRDMAGFPVDSLNRVLNKLQLKNINYKIFEFKDGISNLKDEYDCGEENSYDYVYIIAERYVKNRDRITSFSDRLLKNIENPKIESIISKIEIMINQEI